MMLKIANAIEDIIEKYSNDHRFINDHELNIVCQIDTDEERIEYILAEIDEELPAGIIFSYEYTAGEYEITFKKISEDSIMNPYTNKANILDTKIQNKFGPLDWIGQTLYEDGKYHISFMGPRIQKGETCISTSFVKREEKFFAKMRRIVTMIHHSGYAASMIRFEADRDCPYSESRIEINLTGGEL